MRTLEVKLYKFSELSKEAKQNAIENYRNEGVEDVWWSERVASFDKAKKIYESIEYASDNGNTYGNTIKGARLYTWIMNNLSDQWLDTKCISKGADGKFSISEYEYKYNGSTKKRRSKIFKQNNLENCFLTGVCYDTDFMQPIIDFLKNPSEDINNEDLAENIPSYEKIAERDEEYYNSDEYIEEELENRELEYTEDGKIYEY